MIKLCKSSESYKEISKTLKDNNMEFEHKKCLGKCGLCHDHPFAKSHGKFISADSVEKLIKKLKEDK
ncbi:DUF1450 domain-containing protein [Clostridium bowmanii]|uniref:DUF1450 domain-containing protein n=1 Tax=Clostridium bowmanii TaxID=132925 RepID=UPI001C0E41A9|nr:DUF1450 domain-containing protein [Clostridium bowmanii]MBU3189671.1 DUF1450 domain-containing protein [Clostridium bowmanii]MCA1073484.1 DUF1450 domain-containing protein [Clostridium bowmanii]